MLRGKARAVAAVVCIVIVVMMVLGMILPAFGASPALPRLDGVFLDRDRVYRGGELIVSAEVSDEEEELAKGLTAHFSPRDGGPSLSVALRPNTREEVLESFSGRLTIPDDTPVGLYTLDRVVLEDGDGGRTRYYPAGKSYIPREDTAELDSSPAFTVLRPEGSPVLRSCAVEKKAGGVSILLDTGSDRLSSATLLFENAAIGRKLTAVIDSEDLQETGGYAGFLAIGPYERRGVFTLMSVAIKSRDGEKTTYSARDVKDTLPLTVSAHFAVTSPVEDVTPPVLLSVAGGAPREDGDRTKVAMKVSAADDLSGLDHVTLRFQSAGEDILLCVLREPHRGADGFYRGNVSVLTEDLIPGTYTLESVVLVDKAGNRTVREKDGLPAVSFKFG